MKIDNANFGGVHLVEITKQKDDRGYFNKVFSQTTFHDAKLNHSWAEINISRTYKKGTLRGLHFQIAPSEEIKLVTCLTGRIYDVVVDIRPQSNQFGQWRCFELSEENGLSIYIPKGFAHGFQALQDNCILSYMISCNYNKDFSRGIGYNDPTLKIDWPLPVTCISFQDKTWPLLSKESL